MQKYDFLIVGAGLFGATCAYELNKRGYHVLVIEKRNHVGGNIYTENVDGINVHKYGAHIFHTSDEKVWEYINQFARFNNFINSPLANYKGEMYHLPFNMNTFKEIWPDVNDQKDVTDHIQEEINNYPFKGEDNLEEHAIRQVGLTIYTKLIKDYTEKQWGRPCSTLPSFIIKRLPLRFTYDNNYFNDKYQGIPIGGYTSIIDKMLEGVDVITDVDYLLEKEKYDSLANKIIFTGPIDSYFSYKFGHLEYRSLNFIKKRINKEYFQGNAVVNYTSKDVSYTRIIEHKCFEDTKCDFTIISEEYPIESSGGSERYYPINNKRNQELYSLYEKEASKMKNLFFGGRLGQYKYLDMDKTIIEALNLVDKILNN